MNESFCQARLLVSQHTLRPLRRSLKETPYTGRAERVPAGGDSLVLGANML